MWAAIKALPILAKLGIALGILIALAGIIGGAYYGGYSKGKAISATQIALYQGKVSALNAKLATAQGKVTEKVITQYQDRVKTVTVTQTRNHDVIVEKVVPTFTLTKGWVYSYNQSALGLPIDPQQAADTTPSGISDAKGLLTLNDNNAKYLTVKARLDGLQDWVRQEEKVNEDIGHAQPSNSGSVQHTPSSGSSSDSVSTASSSTDGASR